MDGNTCGRRPSLLTLLTTVATEDANAMMGNGYRGQLPPHSSQEQRSSPTAELNLPVGLEPIQVRNDEIAMNDSSMANAGQLTEDIDPTAGSETTTKYDIRYDPLPYHLATTRTNIPGPRLNQNDTFRPSSFSEERYDAAHVTEAADLLRKERRRQLLGEHHPINLQYDLFQNSVGKRYHQHAKQGDNLALGISRWQSQPQSLRPPYILLKNTTTEDNLVLEPAPVWLNNDAENDKNGDKIGNVGERDQEQRPNQSMINSENSNHLPIRHFHPVNQQQLSEFEERQQELGMQPRRSPILDVHEARAQTRNITDISRQSEHDNNEHRSVADSFQGRPFYPPQQMPQIATNQNLQQLPLRRLDLSLQTEYPPIQQQHQLSLIHDQVALPTSQRGTTPIPTCFEDNSDNDVYEPDQQQTCQKRKRAMRGHMESPETKRKHSNKRDPYPRSEGGNSRHSSAKSASPTKDKSPSTGRARGEVKKARPSGGSDTYIGRVHDMLEDAYTKGFSHVVSWLIHGRAFKIHRPNEFSDEILPKYFHTKRIKSFQRWLSAWGFIRHTEGVDRGAYYHRYFVRGVVLSLVKKLTREEMQQSMDGWLCPGEVANLYSGTVLDYPKSQNMDARVKEGKLSQLGGTKEDGNENDKDNEIMERSTNNQRSLIAYENPKFLRGTLLENIRQMLDDAKEHNFTHIVSWLPGGKTFKVHDKESFQELICGKYFKTGKLTYFSDSLRTWGFCRLKEATGQEHNAYYHRLFQDGKPELCRHFSKVQMVDAMKDFKEEQKRQKEISWSLFPHHRNRQGDKDTEIEQVDTNNKPHSSFKEIPTIGNDELKHLSSASREEDIERTEVINGFKGIDESLNIPPGNSKIPTQQVQDYLATYMNIQNENKDDARNRMNDSVNMMDSSVRRSYGDNFFLGDNYQTVHPNTTIGTANPIDQGDKFVKRGRRGSNVTAEDRPEDQSINTSYATRIHNMLEEVEKKGETHIISWRAHGRAFKIHDEKAFERKILPRYFNATLRSFMRWLNHWGFMRMIAGKDRRCWYHCLFVRGVVELIQDFTRQDLFDAMEEWRVPGKEPDFYSPGKGSEFSERQWVDNDAENTIQNEYAVGETNETRVVQASERIGKKKDPKRLRGTMVEDLRDMLDVAEKEGNTHIVGWLIHGKAFKVHKQGEFETEIMHRHFKASKYRYFVDALRSWGFVILKNGKDKGAYHHKYFLKNEPQLSLHLSRAQMKASMKDWLKSNVADFYMISCLEQEAGEKE